MKKKKKANDISRNERYNLTSRRETAMEGKSRPDSFFAAAYLLENVCIL